MHLDVGIVVDDKTSWFRARSSCFEPVTSDLMSSSAPSRLARRVAVVIASYVSTFPLGADA